MRRTPGLETSGGSLGQGLSVAVGMALSYRFLDNPQNRVYCVLGDGECNEGQVWEAMMSAAHYHLDNLIAIVDYNKVMAKGFVWDLMGIEPFAEKWKAFGWEAVQLNFMTAHDRGEPCPPESNIDAFVRYALDLVELAQVDAVLITCSTMNRSYAQVDAALRPHGVPVVQIDRPMMEQAIEQGDRVLVVATHGPTVESTQALLCETAQEMGRQTTYSGVTVEAAWERLARGDIVGHNETLSRAIRQHMSGEEIGCVVLAQLSMSVFLLSFPDPLETFGVPVLTSAQCGFERVRELLNAADREGRA